MTKWAVLQVERHPHDHYGYHVVGTYPTDEAACDAARALPYEVVVRTTDAGFGRARYSAHWPRLPLGDDGPRTEFGRLLAGYHVRLAR